MAHQSWLDIIFLGQVTSGLQVSKKKARAEGESLKLAPAKRTLPAGVGVGGFRAAGDNLKCARHTPSPRAGSAGLDCDAVTSQEEAPCPGCLMHRPLAG